MLGFPDGKFTTADAHPPSVRDKARASTPRRRSSWAEDGHCSGRRRTRKRGKTESLQSVFGRMWPSPSGPPANIRNGTLPFALRNSGSGRDRPSAGDPKQVKWARDGLSGVLAPAVSVVYVPTAAARNCPDPVCAVSFGRGVTGRTVSGGPGPCRRGAVLEAGHRRGRGKACQACNCDAPGERRVPVADVPGRSPCPPRARDCDMFVNRSAGKLPFMKASGEYR